LFYFRLIKVAEKEEEREREKETKKEIATLKAVVQSLQKKFAAKTIPRPSGSEVPATPVLPGIAQAFALEREL